MRFVGRRSGLCQQAIDRHLEFSVQSAAAEALRIMHPCQAGIELGSQEVEPVSGGRVVCLEEVGDRVGDVRAHGICSKCAMSRICPVRSSAQTARTGCQV